MRRREVASPLISRPLINPRLTSDPRLRVWLIRILICLAAFTAITIWQNWRYGVTAAVVCAAIDTLFRSRTTGIIPASVRVTEAQRSTARRLRALRSAGYTTLNTRQIPGSKSVIDHIVVGPGGIFVLDSQRMDKRLSFTVKGGMLYHGPVSQETELERVQTEAVHAARLIGAELGSTVRVRAAMIVYGPDVPWTIMRFKSVDVLEGKRIPTYLKRQTKAAAEHRLTSAQVSLVVAAAAHAMPALKM
jgi:hypothetical protein